MLNKNQIVLAVLEANDETLKRLSDVLEGSCAEEDMLTTEEFRAELGVSMSTAYKMIYANEVKRVKYRGRLYRIPRSEVARIKNSNRFSA